MARRLFNGRAFSENGWPYVDDAGCTWVDIPGTNAAVQLQIQSGPACTILRALAADYHAFVEPLYNDDCCCFTEGNSVATSNHPGGTACDFRWKSHPFQTRGTFTAAQLQTIQELLDFYEDMAFWAGVDWSEGGWGSPIDEMHWQMGYGTYLSDNAKGWDGGVAPKVFDFIKRKIRADGFSTFRRGAAPATPPATQVLADATGLTVDRATEILPTVVSGLNASQCNNVNRISMWLAQCGEESAGFSTTEEFASGAEYEGRTDLGNTQPGDGVRFKGRTWIQITGRSHYAEFSQWAFDKGLIVSPTQFVDNPTSLGDLQWAGIGAAWYWTVERSDINALSDAGDVVTVTHRINGGENGLSDRQDRYARAHALGDQLLALITTDQGDDDLNDGQDRKLDLIYQEISKRFPSRSPLRHLDQTQFYPGGLVDTFAGMTLNDDGMEHVQYVIALASYNHPDAMALLNELAAGDPAQFPDRAQDIKLAQAILNKVALDKVAKATAVASTASTATAAAPAPVVVNQGISAGDVATIASAAASAVQQAQASTPAAVGGTTGQKLGAAFDSLEALKSDLTPAAKAIVDALIGALQTEIGAPA